VDGKLVELLEVVGGVVQAVFPVESQPADIFLDGVHVLHSSLVGLVSSKRRLQVPPYCLGHPEVQADGFGVADVQVAVGLRGKAGRQAAVVFVGLQIRFDDGFNKVGSGCRFVFVHCIFPWQINLPEWVVWSGVSMQRQYSVRH
jgi:hypothetical protein